MQLNYEDQGTGPALLILHGLFGSAKNWRTVSSRLAEHGFRVLTVDQRNHGSSPHSSEMNFALMAQDVLDLIDQLHLDAAWLLGHSMGGKTAMTLALAHPQRISGLIVADMGPGAYEPGHQEIFDALLGLDPSKFNTRSALEQAISSDLPEVACCDSFCS